MPETKPLICFFVAPFGEKEHQLGGGKVGSFELIRSSIKEIVESFPDIPIVFKRADEIVEVPTISQTFIVALYSADIVIADLSATGNANVFYELGMRFALRKSITIPIWQKGTQLPADVRGLQGVEYEGTNPLANCDRFHDFLRKRLKHQQGDSPVYKELPSLEIVSAEELVTLRSQVKDLEQKIQESLISESVRFLWDEAEQLLLRGDLAAAIEKLKLAYKHAPRNIRLAVRYGQILSRGKKHDDAITVLQAAVALAEEGQGPKSSAYREIGVAYSRAEKPGLAVDWLIKAVQEDPSDSDTHGIIGGVHKQQLEIDKAIESYQRGFDLDQKSTYCLLNVIGLLLARNQAGDKIRVKRLLPNADALTQEAASSPGADHWALYDRAHYLLYASQKAQAIEVFANAIEATKTVGEFESARKNLDLLIDSDVLVDGLKEVIRMFDDRRAST